jgi:hypothetical protein
MAVVREWWFHPDRIIDVRSLYERRGAEDVTLEVSEIDGRRIQEWRLRFRSGARVVYMVETELGPHGPGVGDDTRHVVHRRDHQVVDHPNGKRVTIDCECVMELVAARPGTTTILAVHRHRKVGGKWFERFLPPNNERSLLNRELRALATQCEMDLSSSGDSTV